MTNIISVLLSVVIIGLAIGATDLQPVACERTVVRSAYVPVYEGGVGVEDKLTEQSVMVKTTVWSVCEE